MNTPKRPLGNLFETRSHAWDEAGLAREVAARSAKRARVEVPLLVLLWVAVLVVHSHGKDWFGISDTPDQNALDLVTAVVLVIVGWWIARDVGRAAGPALLRRMDPETAGTVGFLIRLATIGVVVAVALLVAGVKTSTIAVGGSITVLVLGLAAQQTLGNLIAGTVLLSARPFRVGERVRLQGGAIGGRIEGVVSSLGLLYTSFNDGDDRVLVPNSIVLGVAVTPVREPESVSLRARVRAGTTPGELEDRIAASITTPIRSRPSVTLEELDGEELIVQIEATPLHASEGSVLAAELLEAVSRETTS